MPTAYNNHNPGLPVINDNIIGVVCCDDSSIVVDCSSIDVDLVSGHEAIMFTLLIDTIDCVLHQPVRFNLTKTNYTAISHALRPNCVDWINFMYEGVGVEDMWTKFLTYLKCLVKRYVPYKTNYKKMRTQIY